MAVLSVQRNVAPFSEFYLLMTIACTCQKLTVSTSLKDLFQNRPAFRLLYRASLFESSCIPRIVGRVYAEVQYKDGCRRVHAHSAINTPNRFVNLGGEVGRKGKRKSEEAP